MIGKKPMKNRKSRNKNLPKTCPPPKKKCCTIRDPDPRRFHLIDLDNLQGSGSPSMGVVEQTRFDFEFVGNGPEDQMCCSYNHHYSQRVTEGEIKRIWAPALMRPATGANGADQALIAEAKVFLNMPGLTERFDEVIVGSGDHAFIPIVRQFVKRGLTVHLAVRNKASLSKRLQRETNGCIFLLNEQRCLRHDQPKNLAAPGHPNCKTANNQKRNNK